MVGEKFEITILEWLKMLNLSTQKILKFAETNGKKSLKIVHHNIQIFLLDKNYRV